MVLHFYIKICFVILFTFFFAACEKKGEKPPSPSKTDTPKVDLSQGKEGTFVTGGIGGSEALLPDDSPKKLNRAENPDKVLGQGEAVKILADATPNQEHTKRKGFSIVDGSEEATTLKEDPPPAKSEAPPEEVGKLQLLAMPLKRAFTFEEFEARGLLGEHWGKDEHSSISISYIYYLLMYTDDLLKTDQIPENFKKHLRSSCFEGDCSKGIDLNNLTRSHIAQIIKLAGAFFPFFRSNTIVKEKEIHTGKKEVVFVFQGSSEAESMHLWIEEMKKYNVKRIIINLPYMESWSSHLGMFLLLGQYIREREIDLYIEGRCTYLCFNYLLPAAKKIYMGSHGYISSIGTIRGFIKDIRNTLPLHLDKLVERASSSYTDMGFMKKSLSDLIEQSKLTSPRGNNVLEELLVILEAWEGEVGKGIQKKLNDFVYNSGNESVVGLNEGEKESFLKSLSPEEQASLKRFIITTTTETVHPVYKHLSLLDQKFRIESAYYNQAMEIGEDSPLHSKEALGYSFFDFLDLITFLVEDKSYEGKFLVPRAYYRIAEKDKFFEVVPSVDLLRDLGLDIQGENRLEVIPVYRNQFEVYIDLEKLDVDKSLKEKRVLYLDKKHMENCDFFAEAIFFTKETLEKCLYRQ